MYLTLCTAISFFFFFSFSFTDNAVRLICYAKD